MLKVKQSQFWLGLGIEFTQLDSEKDHGLGSNKYFIYVSEIQKLVVPEFVFSEQLDFGAVALVFWNNRLLVQLDIFWTTRGFGIMVCW